MNSYTYAKTRVQFTSNLPNFYSARAYRDGSTLFTAGFSYDWDSPIELTTPATLQFWNYSGNKWIEKTDIVINNKDIACINPRKVLQGDINGDSKIDIFLACTGYDDEPYPGEYNTVLIQENDGSFTAMQLTSLGIGYWHGATMTDMTGNGASDIILVDSNNSNQAIRVYLNDGYGNFSEADFGPQNLESSAYYTVELIDIDGDGIEDLIAGGHEQDGAITKIWINPGNYDFSESVSYELDSVFGQQTVLDFYWRSENSTLYILRTSGGNGEFYTTSVLQSISWPDMEANVVQNQPVVSTGLWTDWIYEFDINGKDVIASDNNNYPTYYDLE